MGLRPCRGVRQPPERTSPYLRAARYSLRLTETVRPTSFAWGIYLKSERGRVRRLPDLGEPLIRVARYIRMLAYHFSVKIWAFSVKRSALLRFALKVWHVICCYKL
jgi:hypothetical protein